MKVKIRKISNYFFSLKILILLAVFFTLFFIQSAAEGAGNVKAQSKNQQKKNTSGKRKKSTSKTVTKKKTETTIRLPGVYVIGEKNIPDIPSQSGSTPAPISNSEDMPHPPPRPAPTPMPLKPKGIISMGVVNGKATDLVEPAYPAAAKAVKATGKVHVQVLIDEKGNVISASAVSGHPLLRQAAQSAARASKFPPTVLSGQPVKVSGIVVYDFTP
jgi:TonB family protein